MSLLKRVDTQLFVIGHSKFYNEENTLYTNIQAGSDYTNEKLCELRDNTFDNRSYLNPCYGELSAIYWIWKNVSCDTRIKYIGQCHYRRLFTFDENEDFDKIFNNFDIITRKPYEFLEDGLTLYKQYQHYHDKEDLDHVIEIVKRLFPEYTEDCERMCELKYLYGCNTFIMKREDYQRFCGFLFTILDALMGLHYTNTVDGIENICREKYDNGHYHLFHGENEKEDCVFYQRRVFGFLSERILTLFIIHNFTKIKEIEINNIEKQDY